VGAGRAVVERVADAVDVGVGAPARRAVDRRAGIEGVGPRVGVGVRAVAGAPVGGIRRVLVRALVIGAGLEVRVWIRSGGGGGAVVADAVVVGVLLAGVRYPGAVVGDVGDVVVVRVGELQRVLDVHATVADRLAGELGIAGIGLLDQRGPDVPRRQRREAT